ncbi:MAG TPA: signal peptidase II [Beutenbergiaceae bacterium]|nr:signal peptidase II [Beutenbergiaceae bacterium]
MTDSTSRATDSAPRSTVSRARALAYLGVGTVLVLAADQATKIAALAALEPGVYHPLLGDWFGLQLVFNPGAAFSLATGLTWVFTIAAVAVTVVIIAVARRLRSRAWAVSLGLLLGGNLGNLGDRLFRDPGFAQGHVVDFLNYGGFVIGNVADIAIVVAAPLIAVLLIRGVGLDGRVESAGSQAGTKADDDTRPDEDAPPGDEPPDPTDQEGDGGDVTPGEAERG